MIFLKHLLRRSSSVLVGFILMFTCSILLPAQTTCPDIQINFDISPVVCFDPSNSLVDLEVEVLGGDGTGTGQWSGPHISNPTTGFFRTTFATPGQQKVYYTYTQGSCTYLDSTTFLYSKLSTPVFLASSEQAGHLCQDSFSILRVISNYDAATTNLVWDLAGGTSVEQGGPDSLHVNWTSPGSKLIRLQYEQYGCLSQPIIQQIVLDPVIDTPMVACDNTLEQVTYEWEDPPNSSATVIFVISGPNGVADTIEDKYTIENLMPGQTVQVRLVTSSDNTCDGNFIEPICASTTCDGDLIDLNPIDKVCVSGGLTDTIDLDYILYDTLTPSTLTWSGAGIFDPTQARIAIDPTMAGQTQWVYVEFQSATCYIRDSVSFELIPPPIADFTLSTTTCVAESITANFTFGSLPTNSDSVLIWGFDGATLTGDPATGSVDLSWNSPGSKTVSLALQDGACVSDTVYRFVNVQAGPEMAQINCNAGPDRILFSWQSIPGATFDVRVIEGPNGTWVSTTSYEISGLAPNQQVTIEVTTNGAGLCNTSTATASCTPIICPDISLAIDPISPVCADANPMSLNLTATITGGDGTGTLRWSGPNVSGNTWTPDLSLSGQSVFLYATYQEGNCIYQDSLEVQVLEQPVADFNLAAASCITDKSTVEAIGTFPSGAVFDWKINGISDPNLMGPGPHDLNWSSPGNQQIGLIITNGQCRSPQITRTIQVQSALPAPVIRCEPGIDQILFTWDPIPGAMEYLLEVLQGPMGNRTSDTSIVFTGLSPGQTIEIAVVLENGGACGNSRSEINCMALGCHDASVTIDRSLLPARVCIADRDSAFQLDAAIVTSIGTGTLVFSGNGVSDTDRTWTVSPAMVGQTHTITATFTEEGCTFTDEVEVEVSSAPTAEFTMTTTLCPGESATITHTGQASAATTYQWSIDSLSGPGPHTVYFNQAGTQSISLMVSEAGCGSDFFEQGVEVLSVFPEPIITCANGLDEVIFSWAPSEATRQEVLYTGPGNPTRSSDTSFVITGLAPETAVAIEIQFIDDAFPCRNSSATASCSSSSCNNLSISWSAPAAICQGEAALITFTTQGAGSSGFDLAIRQNGQTTTHSGITDGNTLSFDLIADATFTLISAGLPGNAACSVTLPDPLTVRVDTPVNNGTQSLFPRFCAGTDTLIQLGDLFINNDPGGQWLFQSGPENPGAAFDPTIGSLRGAPLVAGVYQFQYQSATANACSAPVVDLVIEVLDTPVANAGPDLSLDCQFNLASLGSNLTSPGMTYRWTASDASGILDPNAAITDVSRASNYTLQVRNPSNGCTDTDEVIVSASPGMITPYATIIPVSCFGNQDGMIVLDSIVGGQGPYTFTLNGSDQGTRSTFGNLSAGSYELLVSSSDGCDASLLLNIEAPVELSVELTTNLPVGDESVTLGDSVELTALINIPPDQIAAITWLPDPGTPSGSALTQMVHPLITSSYGVEITDVNGCKAGDRLSIVVNKNSNTYIPTAFSPNEDGSNDLFYLQSDQTVRQITQFSIYDRWGKQVFVNYNFQPNDPAEGWDGNTRSLPQPQGVYIYWAELELASGEVIRVSGDVALLR